jgi:hypothetical protein
MPKFEKLTELVRPDFLAELHHLLWLAPFVNKGQWDEGWNCRDHALVTACLAALHGQTPSILNGKVMLIDSGRGTTPPIGIEASTHSCVGIVDAGIIDLSIRFTRSANPSREVSWPVNGVLHSRATPPGTCNVKVTTKTSDYERAVAEATHRVATRSLIYHLSGGFELTIKNLEHAFDITNSALSDRLRDELRLGSDVYAKAALYLWDFLNGISPPLSTLPQDAAWLAIGARTGNALWRFASRTALR